jgi:FtsH-binding integral membrane protein
MLWLHFIIRVLPVSALALIVTAVGMLGAPQDRITPLTLPLLLVAVLLFAAMLTFRKTGAWNTGLLLGFALVIGFLLSGLRAGGAAYVWVGALGAMLAALACSAVVGRAMRGRLDMIGGGLWLVSWVYLVGWGVIAVMRAGSAFQVVWAAAGLLIFTGLAAAWFSALGGEREELPGVSHAIDLYIFSFNLALAAYVLLRGLSGIGPPL